MNLRSNLLLILFLCISSVVVGQDNKKEIEAQFMSYLNSLISKDFNKAMTYAPDELFEIVPKEQMILLLDRTFNNPEMEIKLKEPKIIRIGESEKIDGKYYSLLTYSNMMGMKFNNSDAKTEDERKMRIDILKATFEKGFGAGKVKYDEQTEFFDIYSEKDVYAVSEDGKTGWKFVVVEKGQKVILEKLLPKQLIKKIDFSKS